MNDDFFETKKPNCPWSLVHKRCLEHDGSIVDLGCLWWDWSRFFIGKKRIIGIDPTENQIAGTELFKGAISNFNGNGKLTSTEGSGQLIPSVDGFPVLTWTDFTQKYNINSISVLKVNIEGSEYDLMKSFTKENFEKIDQLAISFHHFVNRNWMSRTIESLKIIEDNNFMIKDLGVCGWYLCYKK